jgi:hypothetical protein
MYPLILFCGHMTFSRTEKNIKKLFLEVDVDYMTSTHSQLDWNHSCHPLHKMAISNWQFSYLCMSHSLFSSPHTTQIINRAYSTGFSTLLSSPLFWFCCFQSHTIVQHSELSEKNLTDEMCEIIWQHSDDETRMRFASSRRVSSHESLIWESLIRPLRLDRKAIKSWIFQNL